jgi:hypothetical protein
MLSVMKVRGIELDHCFATQNGKEGKERYAGSQVIWNPKKRLVIGADKPLRSYGEGWRQIISPRFK